MRLLLYTRIFRLAGTGAEDYAVKLCTGLARRGHEVHVIADDIDEISGLHTYVDTSRIAALRKQIRPDLTLDWQFVYPADIHRMGSGVHASFIQYSLDAYRGLSRRYKQWRYHNKKHRGIVARQQQLLDNPDAWFLPNSNFCADQARANGANPERVITLHNGVDTLVYSPAADDTQRAQLRRQWGVQDEDVVFLFVAHNLRLKNYPLLARIFAQLQQNNLKLVVVGKHRPSRLPDHCIYAGKVDDIVIAYRAADVLLHPTYYDSCANVVLEAMSCGLPVVASDRCGANELITSDISGYELSVTGDAVVVKQEWDRLIRKLGNDTGLRQHIGRQARKAMLANDFEYYIDRFETILEQVGRHGVVVESGE
jgi:UDP-glucose:(heptosyl)LPS alpha-1,3-glucosyltransferase